MRTPEQNERRRLLILSLEAKRQLYSVKRDRSRTDAKWDMWSAKYWQIANIMPRFYRPLVSSNVQKFGQSDPYVQKYRGPEWWKSQQAARKEEGRQKFLTSYTYSMWFMSNSTTADYGEFECDSCGRTFYHSPSTIRKAGKLVYNCCCGRCTNELIPSTPYR